MAVFANINFTVAVTQTAPRESQFIVAITVRATSVAARNETARTFLRGEVPWLSALLDVPTPT